MKRLFAILLTAVFLLAMSAVYVSAADALYGDINSDGKINNRDLGLLQRYLNEYDVTLNEAMSDVNGDGRINNRDLGLLQQYLNGWDVTLGPDKPDNPVDFAPLQAQYPEVVGWIQIPDTNINYAVMQSGSDTVEDFYLTHNEAGKTQRSGSIYIQKYNHADFSDPNTIVYGHNMANGSMFADVHKFKKGSFFEENEYLYIYLPGHVLTYRIYSLFTHNANHLLWTYDFETEEGRQAFINKTLAPNTSTEQIREGVTPTTADRLITLSTPYGSNNTDRLLLVAVLESDTLTK